jgi:nitrite reductase/ring-hydroxylating ferredoxin subunit
MFKKFPMGIAHKNSADKGMLVTPEYIVSKTDTVNVLNKFCPHRKYPLGTTGEKLEKIECQLHGFSFNSDGSPINNDRQIRCSNIKQGKSGLLWRDFTEPDSVWSDDLSKETNLVYSHITNHTSKGSWLWATDVAIDLFHVKSGTIHPLLMQQVDYSKFVLTEGDGWALQQFSDHGWWLFVYPFTFVEYNKDGCLAINTIIPDDYYNEYGFNWHTQYYYNPDVHADKRLIFETLDLTFDEDVKAAELQKGDYFPLVKMSDDLEKHCVTFGQWVKNNKRDK